MLISLLKALRRGAPQPTPLEAGREALDRGDLPAAVRLLEAAAEAAPADVEAGMLAGQARYRTKAHAEAARHFERCASHAPANADAWCYAGISRLMLNDPESAQRYGERALALDPAHSGAHSLRAAIMMPGPGYTDVLAALHRKLAPRTYVEIGVAAGDSLTAVLPSTRVIGIDPAPKVRDPAPNVRIHAVPSDDYFATRDLKSDLGGLPVDLCFIDGAHVFEQALRDFINLERHATRESTLILHDTFPVSRLSAERERLCVFWSGDVWRLVLVLKKYRPELTIANVACPPTGLCIVRGLDPESTVLARNHDAIVDEFMAVDYDVLERGDRAALLNLFPNDVTRVLELVSAEAPAC